MGGGNTITSQTRGTGGHGATRGDSAMRGRGTSRWEAWLGNPVRILQNSAIIPIPDIFNSGIFI